MIKLIVKNQLDNTLTELDLFGSENINLTLQIDDVRDIENKNASYSKDFNLPATKNNNKFFEHYYNVNRSNVKFTPYKTTKAFLYSEEILILEGYLKLLNVVDIQGEITYNVNLFNDVANVLEVLGDATIADLDFSDIDHNITNTNVANSFTNTGVTLADGTTSIIPFYPLINEGNMTSTSNNFTTYNIYKNYILNIQLKHVIDKIFNLAGFNISSTFLESDTFKKIYFDTTVNTSLGDDNVTFNIIAHTASNVPSGGLDVGIPFNTQLIEFTTELNDTNNYFDATTSTFVAPFDCTVTVGYKVRIESITSSLIAPSAHLMVKTTNAGVPNYIYLDSTPIYGDTTQTYFLTGSINLQQGMSAQFSVVSPYNAGGASHEFVQFPSDTPEGQGYFITLNIVPFNIVEETISNRLGEIKLADIIKDLSKLFNLNFESVGNNTLKIEPYKDFISDTVLDWSKKVDMSEVVIEPINIPKRIEFLHALEEDDYYKNIYNLRYQQQYGSNILELDVENDEVKTIQTEVFSAPYIKKIGFSNVYCQHITKYEDGEYLAYDNKPRLVFKHGFEFTDNVFESTFGAAGVLGSKYTNATMYETKLQDVQASTNSLLFGLINTTQLDTIIPAQPINTLFNVYWFDYINERYNVSEGLILKVKANLTPNDITTFSFAKKIRINEQLYRVNKIEFNTDRKLLANLELLKI